MFSELPEDLRPENFPFPTVNILGWSQFQHQTNNFSTTPIHLAVDGCEFTENVYIRASTMYIFAEAKHIEFVDAFTRRLVYPIESFYIPIFKSIAKTYGPFVAFGQFGFKSPREAYLFSPTKTADMDRRVVALMDVFGDLSLYALKEAARKRLAKRLDLTQWSHEIGVYNPRVGLSNAPRTGSVMLYSRPKVILATREVDNENE